MFINQRLNANNIQAKVKANPPRGCGIVNKLLFSVKALVYIGMQNIIPPAAINPNGQATIETIRYLKMLVYLLQ